MRQLLILLLASIFVFFTACLEEYTIPKEETITTISDIVIQGRILSGDKSIIYITRTQPLNSKEESESVLNAQVTIIGENGYESELAEFDIENDYYYVDTKELPNNTLYALQVKVDNEVLSIRIPTDIDHSRNR